jgi:very-short-patch-repair endonuclease
MTSGSYNVAGKVFILGEYSVLGGFPAVVASVAPRFSGATSRTSTREDKYHPESPVGRFLLWAQSSEEVYELNSEFENAVAHLLRQRGFEVVPQVGVASYRIDLAVRHPNDPGRYILGIECDGATYHAGRSARDRDRLRQAALEKLGWRIHRIWSPDWFRNRKREIDKVVCRINEALQVGQ